MTSGSATSAAPSVLQVFVFRQGKFLGTDLFTQCKVVVGRDPGNADLVLESASVSRTHAEIEIRGTQIGICDSGSTNGVYVNGSRITRSLVTALDEVGVGEFMLKLKLVAADRRAALAKADRAPAHVETRVVQVKALHKAAEQDEAQSLPPEIAPSAPVADRTRSADEEATRRDIDSKQAPAVPAPSRSSFRTLFRRATARPESPSVKPKLEIPAPRDALPEVRAEPEPVKAPWRPPAPEYDEEEDEPFVPAFSVVERLAAEDGAKPGKVDDGVWRIAVMALRDGRLLNNQLLAPGESYWTGPRLGFLARRRMRDVPTPIRLVTMKPDGGCRLELRRQAAGHVLRDGHKTDLAVIASEAHANPRRAAYRAKLNPGEILELQDGLVHYRVRYVHTPAFFQNAAKPWKERLKLDKVTRGSFGGSLASHLIVMIVLSVFAPRSSPGLDSVKLQEDFVEIRLDNRMELEQPPAPAAPPRPEAPAATSKVAPKMQPAPSKARPRAGGTSKGPPGVLGLLSKKGSSAAPGAAAAVAAASNVAAVRVAGPSSGFKMSGLQSKMPTSRISLGGGGGGVDTKGALALLRGGGGGAGVLSGTGSREVGGLVQKVPKAMQAAGQGTLDRAEIQRVINENIGQIQRCYERELVKTPDLSGKVQVQWVITTSGSVRSVQQAFTSLKSTEVVNCIMGKIRTWQFARPKGGEVVVNYPFIFRSTSF